MARYDARKKGGAEEIMYVHNARPLTKPGSPWYWVEGGFWTSFCFVAGLLIMSVGVNPLIWGVIGFGGLFWLMGTVMFIAWWIDWKAYMERMPAPAKPKHLFTRKPKNKMTLSEVIVECQKAENKKRYLKRRFEERSISEAVETPAVKVAASEELIE